MDFNFTHFNCTETTNVIDASTLVVTIPNTETATFQDTRIISATTFKTKFTTFEKDSTFPEETTSITTEITTYQDTTTDSEVTNIMSNGITTTEITTIHIETNENIETTTNPTEAIEIITEGEEHSKLTTIHSTETYEYFQEHVEIPGI